MKQNTRTCTYITAMSHLQALQYFSDLCHFELALHFRLPCFSIKDSFHFNSVINFLGLNFIKAQV